MAFIVTEACIKCKHTDCVEVCPVDCFYEGPNFLVIHPEECIDCALCEPECPVEAIFSEDELPDDQIEFIEINAELSEIWPNITEEKDQRVVCVFRGVQRIPYSADTVVHFHKRPILHIARAVHPLVRAVYCVPFL